MSCANSGGDHGSQLTVDSFPNTLHINVVNMKISIIYFSIVASLISWAGCGSCCTFKGEESGTINQRQDNTGSPAYIKSNLSSVEAVIDSIVIIDDVLFEVDMRLVSVAPAGGSESIAEQGQHIRAIPLFSHSSGTVPDTDNQRNKNLLSLRSAKSGARLKGIVTFSREGKWMLVDVNK